MAALLILSVSAAVPVSVPHRPPASGAGHSYLPVFSADGLHVGFVSQANNLVTNDDLGPSLDLFVRDLTASNTVLVSVGSNGFGGANRDVSTFALSSNARVVAFETPASNLVPGDTNQASDIFVRDLAAGVMRLVSVSADGTGPGNGPSYNPLLSADGRYVIFESLASNLVTNDFNGTNDVFLRDIVAGTTTLVSANADNTASADGSSHSPSISANGRFVAFVSTATNIVSGVTNRAGEIYVRDLDGDVTVWAAAAHVFGASDPLTRSYSALQPALSADGRFVAFKTQRGALVRFDTSRTTNRVVLAFPGSPTVTDSNYFLFQDNPRLAGPVLANGPGGPTPGGFGDAALAFSPDGRFAGFTAGTNAPGLMQTVLRADFESFATNLSFCCEGALGQSWITNQIPEVRIVSTNFGFTHLAPPRSFAPVMSADGALVTFVSDAANASGMSTGLYFRVCLRNMATDVIDSITTNNTGVVGRVANDVLPGLSADGKRMVWESDDDQLVPDDLNGASDVFVRDLQTGATTLISARHPALAAATGRASASVAAGALTPTGGRIAFFSAISNLAPDDTNQWRDAFLRDLAAGTNLYLSGPVFAITNIASGQYFPTNIAAIAQLDASGRRALFGASSTLIWRDLLTGSNRVVAVDESATRATLSPDGRLVFFHATEPIYAPDATFLLDANGGASDIYVWDSAPPPAAPRVTVLSAVTIGNSPGNAASINPVLSPDGCRLAFLSRADNLTGDSFGNASFQVFARDGLCHPTNFLSGTNRLMSYRTTASPLVNGRSLDQPWPGGATNPVFSADGSYLFFKDGVSNVIYRHDLSNKFVVKIFVTNNLSYTNIARVTNLTICTGCLNPSPNLDGRMIAYEVPETNGLTNIVLRDIVSGATELVSANLAGTGGGNGSSFTPLLSFDGRFVVFTSKASDLVANDTNRATDIFVRDRQAGVTHCLSLNRFGTATGNRVSSQPVLSADGRTVAFQSFASDLVPGDYNDTRDVFVVSLAGPDTDGDGLDDDWEVAYFNDLTRDGTGDFDHDGASDAEEFRTGTDPAATASVLRVLTLTTAAGPQSSAPRTTTLFWASTPFRRYRVQFKDSDVNGPWTDLPGDVLATGTTASKAHVTQAGGSPRAFYRVRLVE